MALNSNISLTKKYLVFLRESLTIGWKEYHDYLMQIESKQDCILGKLALLHPDHYKKLNPKLDKAGLALVQDKIQGKRTFNYSINYQKCSSIELWGYECPLHDEPLVWDHDFPYSFGGTTDNTGNKRLLCRWHNMIKGNDIHIYNWLKLVDDYHQFQRDNGRIHWIDLQIEKIIKEFNL
jgi:hypothetical protein